jgi:hypothetical protein
MIENIIKNKYYKWYSSIIQKSKNRTLPKHIKCEIHHILPKSLGGSDDTENLVRLTLKEHWVCHRLLVKFLSDPKDVRKMYNALWMMLQKDYRTVNARIYETVKENKKPWNIGTKGRYPYPNKTPDHVKQYLSNLHKGKKRSKEDIEKMKEGWKKRKETGYTVWNKGKTIPGTRNVKCKFISPDGIEYFYNSQKEGCVAHGLPTDKISQVKTGNLKNYKGWRVYAI